jgi:hypothetical protein
MSDRTGVTAMTTTSTLSRGFPTLSSLFRWVGKSRRRKWTVVAALLAMVAGPPLWWWAQLMGLPDIGEPFDVERFRSFKIPDDGNAHLLYFRAAKLLKPLKTGRQASGQPVDMLARWSSADPEVRR